MGRGYTLNRRILLMTSSYPPVLGGLQTVVHTLARDLLRQGCDVCVLTNRYPRSLPPREVLEGVSVTRWTFLNPDLGHLRRGRPDLFLASLHLFPAALLRLRRLMRGFQPSVVNVHFPDSQIPFVLWAQRRFPFRLVVSLHGHDVERWLWADEDATRPRPAGRTNSLPPTPFRLILQAADRVTACSRDLLNNAIQLEPTVAAKGQVLYNGVDLQRFCDKAAYSHPRPYVLAFGRLTPHKGFDLLIEAFMHVASAYPEADLLLAGEGEERHALEAQTQRLGLNGRVHFVGRANPETVVHLLNGCLFMVVPSRREPFGIVALEAMAAGKAVLATRVGGLPELLPQPPNVYVEPTSAALAQVLAEWLARLEHVQRAGQQNAEAARAFAWENALAAYRRALFTSE
jgi:glycosyltransferase involved in cell wall biosynthesis